jgi:mono/diheme cytochrome c family protein
MRRRWLCLVALLLTLASCKRDDMADQARGKPMAASPLFADGTLSRQPPVHTVSVDAAPDAPSGPSWTEPATATRFPFEITRNDLVRGQRQFTIYCSPCHGESGNGDGMIAERGLTRPPSYHTQRLRDATPAYFYDVMTKGIGAMFPLSDRVAPDDRWRIAAYIRALQLSQAGGTSTAPQGGPGR